MYYQTPNGKSAKRFLEYSTLANNYFYFDEVDYVLSKVFDGFYVPVHVPFHKINLIKYSTLSALKGNVW